VICWPSRFSWKSSSRLTPGVLPTSLAVMPLISFDSSIQLRPCTGQLLHLRRIDVAGTATRSCRPAAIREHGQRSLTRSELS
jgi:hypothetical protein